MSLCGYCTMRTLTIRMLHGSEVFVEEQRIESFQDSKALGLLLYLAMQEHAVSRDYLHRFLWPDSTSNAGFRQSLSRLRRALGDTEEEEHLFLGGNALLLSPTNPLDFDILEFQKLVQGVDFQNRQTLFNAKNIRRLNRAATMYQNHFLEGEKRLQSIQPFQEWLQKIRSSLEQQIYQVLTTLMAYHSYRDAEGEALEAGYQLLRLFPLHEEAFRHVCQLELRNGQLDKVKGLATTFAKKFKKQLGSPLSKETQEFLDSLKKLPSTPPSNLTPLQQPFIGRTEEAALVQELLLLRKQRLVTLLGPGGIGKTTFARSLGERFARKRLTPFIGGVFLLDLTLLPENDTTRQQIWELLATTFSLSLTPARTLQSRIFKRLQKWNTLLLFDNAEHILEPLKSCLTTLLKQTKRSCFLVTSRQLLTLKAEQRVALQGLTVPKEPEEALSVTGQYKQPLADNESISLFVQRAQQQQPSYQWGALKQSEKVALIRLCRLVEGMPLALELAAAWVGELSCQSMVEELQQTLEVLQSLYADTPSRHRSVEAVFTAAWNRLTNEEKAVLQSLTVFPNVFGRKAAEFVSHQNYFRLRSLRDKSLLESLENERFRLHNLVKLFVSRTPEVSTTQTEARQRHLTYFSDFAKLWYPQRFIEGSKVRELLCLESGNLRHAWDLALQQGDWNHLETLLEPLCMVYNLLDRLTDGSLMLKEFLEQSAHQLPQKTSIEQHQNKVLLTALLKQGEWLSILGQLEESVQHFERILELVEGDLTESVGFHANRSLGTIAMMLGRYQKARQRFEKGAEVLDTIEQNDVQRAYFHISYASALLAEGVQGPVEEQLQQAFAIYESQNNLDGLGHYYRFLGQLRLVQQRYDEAREYLENSLEYYKQRPMAASLIKGLLAQLEQLEGTEPEYARELFEEALKDEGVQASEYLYSQLLSPYGGLLLEMEQPEKAQKALSTALTIATERGYTPVLLSLYHQMARALALQGKHEQAYSLLLTVTEHSGTHSLQRSDAGKYRIQLEKELPLPVLQQLLSEFEQSPPDALPAFFASVQSLLLSSSEEN